MGQLSSGKIFFCITFANLTCEVNCGQQTAFLSFISQEVGIICKPFSNSTIEYNSSMMKTIVSFFSLFYLTNIFEIINYYAAMGRLQTYYLLLMVV